MAACRRVSKISATSGLTTSEIQASWNRPGTWRSRQKRRRAGRPNRDSQLRSKDVVLGGRAVDKRIGSIQQIFRKPALLSVRWFSYVLLGAHRSSSTA